MALNIFKKEQEDVELFWSIVISRAWVDTCIWKIIDEQVEIVAQGGASSWEQARPETLIEATDSSLSSAISELSDEIKEPSKVVFGVPSFWTQDGEIKKEHVDTLKKLSRELELVPSGFVVIPEAIVHFLKAKEGTPPNVILVGLDDETCELTLVVSGKVQGTVEVGRSMSLASDLQEGLAHLPSVLQYPTTILLYNHRAVDLEDVRQSLIETKWEEAGITFLHTPKVDILAEDIGIKACSLAGGAEVGGAKSLVLKEAKTREEVPDLEKISQEPQEQADELSNIVPVDEVSPEDLGFTKDVDAAILTSASAKAPAPKVQEVQSVQAVQEVQKRLSMIRFPSLSLGGLFIGGSLRLKIFVFLGFLLLAAFGISYWYLPKAKVTIFVSARKIDKTIAINVGKDVVGKTFETAISAQKTVSTTGTKMIGERAKGEVTIYRAGSAVTLPKGTVLTSNGGLKFTLDSDVRVASGSAGPDTLGKNIDPAKVTASSIGAQYNMGAGSTFSIGSLSSDTTTAKNDVAFSGGTSREISAVSDQDRKSAEEEVLSEMKKLAVEKAKKEISDDEIIFEETGKLTLDKREFDKKVGDESQTLTLNAGGTASFLVVQKNSLQNFVASQVKGDVPEGFYLPQEQIEAKIANQNKDGTYDAAVSFNLLPSVNPEKITKDIAGKSPSLAKEILSQIPGFTRAQISFKLKFPPPFGTLPRVSKNIVVEVVSEK